MSERWKRWHRALLGLSLRKNVTETACRDTDNGVEKAFEITVFISILSPVAVGFAVKGNRRYDGPAG